MKRVKSKIKPIVKDQDQISFTIDVDQKATISGQEAITNFKKHQEFVNYLEKLEREAEQQIEQEISKVVDKAQQEFQSDIIGFGDALSKADSKAWNRVKKDWSEKFCEVDFTVNVKVTIVNTGLLQGTFKSGN